MENYNKIKDACDFISSLTSTRPKKSITLGTGLSGVLSQEVEVEIAIPYKDIPHFPKATVESHRGELIIGKWKSIDVIFLSGRFHFYEGYNMSDVTFAIRALSLLGVDHFLFTNVAGGINPMYETGDIVFVNDHIYMMPENPLRGHNEGRFGPRFPDMSKVYDKQLIEWGLRHCVDHDIRAHSGVYYCLQGPNLETPAEYEMIYRVGADLVGMSTIPEVIVAKHMGARVNAISIVSNVCYPKERVMNTTIEEVISVAQQASPSLVSVVKELLVSK